MAVDAFIPIRAVDLILRIQVAVCAFQFGFSHDIPGNRLIVYPASQIESLLDLVAACTIPGRILVVADSTALPGGDEFAVFPDVGMTDTALDLLFDQMTFMGKIQSEDLSVDFFDSGMTVRALGRDFFGRGQKTFGFVRRLNDTQRLDHRIVGRAEQFLGISHVMDTLPSFHDIDVKCRIIQQRLGFHSAGVLGPGDFLPDFLKNGLDLNQLFFSGCLPLLENPGKAFSVAGFTGCCPRNEGLTFDDLSSLFFMEDMASLTAQAFFQHDVGHRMGISLASFTRKQDLLGLMQVQVTALAFSNGLNLFDYFVLDVQVTLIALDLMRVNMGQVHEVCIVVFVQPLCFHVAFEAVFSRDLAVSKDGMAVAFVAFEPAVKHERMVVSGGFL